MRFGLLAKSEIELEITNQESQRELRTLITELVDSAGVKRVLEIGLGEAERMQQIALRLPTNGLLIAIERDPERARIARELSTSTGQSSKVSVLVGDPARYLHKVAGPFDLIVQDGGNGDPAARHERLWQLLRPSGHLVTHGLASCAGYNGRLTADTRFQTTVLPIGNGVAVSVKAVHDDD